MAIEEFSEMRNLARVTAGLKEPGPFYNNLLTPQQRTFESGYPAEWTEKVMGAPIVDSPIEDTWNVRRSNGIMK